MKTEEMAVPDKSTKGEIVTASKSNNGDMNTVTSVSEVGAIKNASTTATNTTRTRRKRRWDDQAPTTSNIDATVVPPTTTLVTSTSNSVPSQIGNNSSAAVPSTLIDGDVSENKKIKVSSSDTISTTVIPGFVPSATTSTTVPSIVAPDIVSTSTVNISAASASVPDVAAPTTVPTKKVSRWDSKPSNVPSKSATVVTQQQQQQQGEGGEDNSGGEIIKTATATEKLETLAVSTTAVANTVPSGFHMPVPDDSLATKTSHAAELGVSIQPSTIEAPGGLPHIKREDLKFFGKLLQTVDNEDELSKDEQMERKVATMLLKIKCGTPPQRKTALRQITENARAFGAERLFNQILPLLMSPSLEDHERHRLVKVVDRVLYKLDELTRPYVSRILAVIEPMLIEEDYYARIEGREVISNLAKAAGLPTMIATMRPDLDSSDEYVRNITSRAFAVVAVALGVPQVIPFLKAVCQSKKSWQARHTGIKIVQQIALLQGCAVLPHLRDLVDIVRHGLTDDERKIRTITALTLAALAESSFPYGIESFDSVIRPLWKGSLEHHSKGLAAFLKAIGFIIPLMEENYASHYTKLVMPILIREFLSPDEEMKKVVLKVIQQCVATAGVEPDYIRNEILPDFFRSFWVRRMALDRRNHKQVVEATVELSNKVGAGDIISRIVDDLKDDSQPYRRMVMETIQKVLENLGAGDIDERLEERLIDGMLFSFQEQAVVDDNIGGGGPSNKDSEIMLDSFGAVMTAFGRRCGPYLKQIVGTIKWRLNNKVASVRMQAADLISRIAVVLKACEEDTLMGHLGVVLYEYLGEEYPDVLGSILGALRAIVTVIGMTRMTPPIRDLLPRLAPILRNRHEKVQENCIDLVGRIADRGAEFVSAKEWMRICFELLEMLKANRKSIRRAAVSTFGYIAKAIGPQDVLHTLLNNLKVQDRTMRVCTTVAIAIVAETCGPFTVLPALMNEYRVPELNIQNGVLKALSFMFEYIGDMASDYAYAVAPLIQDALMERDPVHRQTACAVVRHLSLGVAGMGCEDVLIHLMNYIWPNVFEDSPHVRNAYLDAVGGLMVAVGPNVVLQYVVQGLYHPARKVREAYWNIYNILYIYASDALVAGYPELAESEDDSVYTRSTLHVFI